MKLKVKNYKNICNLDLNIDENKINYIFESYPVYEITDSTGKYQYYKNSQITINIFLY